MFVDFSKYNNKITDVSFNEDGDYLVLQTSLYKIAITACGECCSRSILEEYKEYKFNNLVDKTIKKINEIELPADFTCEEIYECVSPHLYEIKFKNSNEKFYFILKNYSNGYYDGYLRTNIIL